MTAEHVNILFYGLFMDMGLLQQRGLAPRHPQVARLDGYDIDIRERATLIRHAAARVYGMVTGLTHEEIGTLYADPSVRDYRPEAVVVTLADDRQVPVWCDNLPQVTGSRRNTGYAVRLVEVAKTLAFPEHISIDSRGLLNKSQHRAADGLQHPLRSRSQARLTASIGPSCVIHGAVCRSMK